MINNPYNISSPVIGPQLFGRAELLSSILRTFDSSAQNAVTVFGQARLGKTSVLQEVANQLADQEYVPVYWELEDKTNLSLERALRSLAKVVAEKVQPGSLNLQASDVDSFKTRFLPQMFKRIGSRRLVLLLDDIDTLAESGDKADSLITYFQKLIVDEQSIAFVLSTSTKFQDLPIAFQRIGKQVRVEELTFLTPHEVRSLITELAQETPVNYSPEAIRAITDLSAGHPYFTQLICHEIFEHALREDKTHIDKDTINVVLPSILEKSALHFKQSIAGLSNNELYILSACASIFEQTEFVTPKSLSNTLQQNQIVVTDIEIERTLNELQRRDILTKAKQGVFSFTVPLLAHWVIEEYPLPHVPPPKPNRLLSTSASVAALLVLAAIGFFIWRSLPPSTITATPTTSAIVMSHTPTAPLGLTPSPTEKPTAEPTPGSTTGPTEVPTAAPTETPTEAPTEVPTEVPTEAPTAAPSETSTEAPTEVPTEVPTEAPTAAPVVAALPADLRFLDLDVVGTGRFELIYALAKDDGIYRRDANGSWSFFSSDLNDADKMRTLEAQSAATLYVGYDDGVRRWTAAEGWSAKANLPRVHDLAVVPNTEIVFAGTDQGVYRSTDDGITWEAMNQRLNNESIAEAVYSLAIGQDQSENWVLYAAGAYGAQIFKTTIDPGRESSIPAPDPRWEDVLCDCGTDKRFFAVAVDPANAETVYVGNDRSRVSFSSNGGASWTTKVVPVGGVVEVFITKIVVAKGNVAAYAATGSDGAGYASNGVLVRKNNEWLAVRPPDFVPGRDYVQGIAMDPDNPQVIYVGGSNGLFEFDSRVQEWIPSP